jgi:molybdopterin molybdotransferase
MVCSLLFLKPAMERMMGQTGGLPATVPARLAIDVKQNDQREDYVRSLATRQPDGSLTVEPHKVQDSSMLSVLAWCNALLIRPPHDPAKKAGDTVQIVELSVLPVAIDPPCSWEKLTNPQN